MLQPDHDPLQTGIRWLRNSALPLWTSAGWDEDDGMFVERLDLDGRPLIHAPRRVMVQARQVFVMAVTCRRNWLTGADRFLERTVRNMIRRYHAVDGKPGWAFSVGKDGSVDLHRDLYAHAFVLLALASAYSATNDIEYRRLAASTLSFLTETMRSAAGGFVETWPEQSEFRRQNPHMHLFEAMLAWHEADPDGTWLLTADKLLALLERKMLRGKPPVLAEVFGPDWSLPSGEEISFEPGHHFEWIWLLDRFSTSGGRASASLSDSLASAALRHGVGPNGRIYDEVSAAGRPVSRSTRLWPHAEAAKAMTTECARRLGGPAPEVFLTVLRRDFLDPANSGSWLDHLDQTGCVLSSFAPASSLYHLVCAYDEIQRVDPRFATSAVPPHLSETCPQ